MHLPVQADHDLRGQDITTLSAAGVLALVSQPLAKHTGGVDGPRRHSARQAREQAQPGKEETMAPTIVAVLIITAIVIAGVVYFTRAEVSEVERKEKRLGEGRSPTVAFPIPNGVDPVPISTALRTEGFDSMPDRVDDRECLVIECRPGDRERVREIIAGAHDNPSDESSIRIDRVVFQDER
jgi:hypothetical protein